MGLSLSKNAKQSDNVSALPGYTSVLKPTAPPEPETTKPVLSLKSCRVHMIGSLVLETDMAAKDFKGKKDQVLTSILDYGCFRSADREIALMVYLTLASKLKKDTIGENLDLYWSELNEQLILSIDGPPDHNIKSNVSFVHTEQFGSQSIVITFKLDILPSNRPGFPLKKYLENQYEGDAAKWNAELSTFNISATEDYFSI
jgi:hypothetical protein